MEKMPAPVLAQAAPMPRQTAPAQADAPVYEMGMTRMPPPPDQPRLVPLRGLLSELTADNDRRRESHLTGAPLGAQSGFPALDDALGGCFSPGLHIVHGSPGAGKTAWAVKPLQGQQRRSLCG